MWWYETRSLLLSTKQNRNSSATGITHKLLFIKFLVQFDDYNFNFFLNYKRCNVTFTVILMSPFFFHFIYFLIVTAYSLRLTQQTALSHERFFLLIYFIRHVKSRRLQFVFHKCSDPVWSAHRPFPEQGSPCTFQL